MNPKPSLPPALFQTIPWSKENQAIWMASTLSLHRNLSRYPFPSKMQNTEEEAILQSIKKSLEELPELGSPTFALQQELTSSQRELFFEHFLFLNGLQEPPQKSAVCIDSKGDFLALINSRDHLEMRFLNLDHEGTKSWNFLSQLEDKLYKKLEFAFSAKFGYLTSDLSCCGTGLKVCSYLHLPALVQTKQLKGALASIEEDEILFSSLSGDLEHLIGDVIVIQNNFSLGVSEEALLLALQKATTKLISAEQTLRAQLKQEPHIELKDLVSKSFGILTHSYQLEIKEALDLLSLIKLGVCLDYIQGVESHKLSELFFQCRRGHLLHLFPNLQDAKEIAHKRAEFLHQELKGMHLSTL